jgi:hypothetical protein
MSSTLDVHSPAAPDVVLAAIRTHAGYWQESIVPETLRRRGLVGVDAHVTGRRFSLVGQDLNRDPPVLDYMLEGGVTATPDGGSRIHVSLAPTENPRGGMAVALAGLGVVAGLSGQKWLGAVLLGLAALVWQRRQHPVDSAAVLANDVGAAHLVARLQLAIEAAHSAISNRAV